MQECASGLQWTYDYKAMRVHVDYNYQWRSGEHTAREKAVRKLRRALYENGFTKEDIYSSYGSELVMVGEEVVAEWDHKEQQMNFTKDGDKYKEAFRRLMAHTA